MKKKKLYEQKGKAENIEQDLSHVRHRHELRFRWKYSIG